MTETDKPDWVSGVETIVRDPLRFKLKLDIGEEAYKSLRAKKYFLEAVDAGAGAVTGFGIAKSAAVATTFFAPTGFLGAIGLGTAATPIGWAIAAGVVGAGFSVVLGRYFIRGSGRKVYKIPECINTPLDLLAMGLFDMIAMLSVKVAMVDGNLDDADRALLTRYFEREWGYDRGFVEAGLTEIVEQSRDHGIQEIASRLAEFQKANPDCNYASMAREVTRFLAEICGTDASPDPRRQAEIEKVRRIFAEVGESAFSKSARGGLGRLALLGKKGIGAVGAGLLGAGRAVKSAGGGIAGRIRGKRGRE